MSSLHKQPGRPFLFCAFIDQKGKRHFKSTKTSDKKEARRICDAWQKAADFARAGTLDEHRARKVVEDVVQEILETSGIKVQRLSVQDYLDSWLKEKEIETEPSTSALYARLVKQFLEFIGDKRKQNLSHLRSDDVQAFRDHLLKTGRASATCNMHLHILRLALDKAVRRNLIERNPAKFVETVARTDKHHRRAFTLDELRKLLAVASEDWQTAILIGIYSGLRLGDIAELTWANVDVGKQEITVRTRKTKRTVILPIAAPLLKRLESLPASDDPTAPILPDMFGQPVHYLSNRFYSLMASAGLVPVRKKGKSEDKIRRQSDVTFHSLRHTATSLLKNAGVSDVIARDIIGHESAAISAHYTHIETATKRQALDRLPDITK